MRGRSRRPSISNVSGTEGTTKGRCDHHVTDRSADTPSESNADSASVGAGRLLAFASSQPASPTSWPQDIRFKGGIQRDVFIVGAANVGKSSVVNQFINRPARSKAQRKDSDHQPQPKRRGKKQKHVSITLDELPPGYVREARLLLADTCSLVVATAAFRWEMFSLAVLTT